MKSIFNIYTLIAIVLSSVLFYLSFQLRQQPVYTFIKTVQQGYRGEKLSELYSADYINSIKRNYFPAADSLSFVIGTIPDDSVFIISLRQIIIRGIHESNQFPTVTFINGKDIESRIHIKARENFDLIIRFKKINDRYIFHDISNLNLLLHYYPAERKAFEKFIPTTKI